VRFAALVGGRGTGIPARPWLTGKQNVYKFVLFWQVNYTGAERHSQNLLRTALTNR
jgi:hypothetical protein